LEFSTTETTMSQKCPYWWDRSAGRDLRGSSVKRHIKRCYHRVNRRKSKQVARAETTTPYEYRLRECAHKAIGIHHDYAEAAYFDYQMCPEGYGGEYLARAEDQTIAALAQKYGFSVDEVEGEVQRLCYEGAYDHA
jgi:hypothetical protein